MKESKSYNWSLLSRYRTELYGISAIMIVIFHMKNIVPYPYTIPHIPFNFSLITEYFNFGVDVFLLLSGMSLYFSLVKKPKYTLYIKKRAERVLIPYLVISLPFSIFNYFFHKWGLIRLILDLTGLSLYVSYEDGNWVFIVRKMWYIAFALVAYALYPAVYRFIYRRDSQLSQTVKTLLMIAAFVSLTIFMKVSIPEEYYETLEIYFTKVPVFLVGCLLGKRVYENKSFSKFDIISVFLSILITVPYQILFDKTHDYIFVRYWELFIAYAFCIIVPVCLEFFNLKKLYKIFTFFGNISLELYLIHIYLYNHTKKAIFPDILDSDAWTKPQKYLVYFCIILISVILSKLFQFAYGKILSYVNHKS